MEDMVWFVSNDTHMVSYLHLKLSSAGKILGLPMNWCINMIGCLTFPFRFSTTTILSNSAFSEN